MSNEPTEQQTVEVTPGGGRPAAATPLERAFAHVRKYVPYYALGIVWIVMIAFLPTVRPDRTESGVGLGSSATGSSLDGFDGSQLPDGFEAADASAAEGGAQATTSGGARGVVSRGRTGAAVGPATPVQVGKVSVGTGKTRAGFECKPGVRQLPWSNYAPLCVEAFSGENGGPTFRGVTKDKIVVAQRFYPSNANQETLVASICGSGRCPTPPSQEQQKKIRQTFIDYFNAAFELYGRKIEFVDFEANPQADQFAELRGEGQEGACADATKITEEIKAFASTNGGGVGAAAFDECAAKRKLPVLTGAYGAPEDFYVRLRPYIWQQTMSCSRISYHVPEYVGKRLNGKPAKWAGDPAFRTQTRKFGSIRSNITIFDPCLDVTAREMDRYKVTIPSTYTYVFDPSRYAEDAARAAVQFKAAGINSLIISADMLFMVFLTQQANNQRWYPEWVIIGSGNQDVDTFVRLWDQDAIRGALFGMSQLSSEEKLLGPTSEPAITYKRITGQDLPANTTGGYWNLLWVFMMMQMAGPNLTPENIEKGVFSSYPKSGGLRAEVGTWDFSVLPDGTPGNEHTAIDDSREVYWTGNKYVETYGGKRFTNGQWPVEDPPIYPEKK